MAEIELRPDVQWFAEQMELKLRENDHKGGWEGVTPLWLMARLREELDELEPGKARPAFAGMTWAIVCQQMECGNRQMKGTTHWRDHMALEKSEVNRRRPTKDDVFYSHPDSERLLHWTVFDAVEEYVDDCDCRADVPLLVPMAEYSRMSVGTIEFYEPLERLIESLEEEYGDWDGERDVVTPRMKEAEKAFLQVVLDEYVPYPCDIDRRFILVNVQPSGECCTFETGCCSSASTQCNLHKPYVHS